MDSNYIFEILLQFKYEIDMSKAVARSFSSKLMFLKI